MGLTVAFSHCRLMHIVQPATASSIKVEFDEDEVPKARCRAQTPRQVSSCPTRQLHLQPHSSGSNFFTQQQQHELGHSSHKEALTMILIEVNDGTFLVSRTQKGHGTIKFYGLRKMWHLLRPDRASAPLIHPKLHGRGSAMLGREPTL